MAEQAQAVLILGASSDIARSLAHLYASKGHPLYLAARNLERIQADIQDLQIRYKIPVTGLEFDAVEYEAHDAFVEALDPFPRIAICVFGYLGDQELAQKNWDEAHRTLAVNYVGAVSVMNRLAEKMEAKGAGQLIGISSVAGDRGRGSNYLYGSAKAGFSAYLSGLRNRLAKQGVHVLTVKPGFVRTSMTEGMPLPAPLTAEPQQVAKDIYKAVNKGKNTLYTLWMWKYVMLIIRNIPEFIFKKLSL